MLDYAQRITPSNDSCKQCVYLKPWIREGKALLTKHTAHYKKKIISITISKASPGTCEKHNRTCPLSLKLGCPVPKHLRKSHWDPNQSYGSHIYVSETKLMALTWVLRERALHSLVSGFSCRGFPPLLGSSDQNHIPHLPWEPEGRGVGAAQRITYNGSKTAVATWLCAQECDTSGSVPHRTLGVPSAALQHQLPLLPPPPTLKLHQCWKHCQGHSQALHRPWQEELK